MTDKCPHGYFTSNVSSHRCPWCFGFDTSNRDAVPVVGHGNGWLLRSGEPIFISCGGPSVAGWGMRTHQASERPPSMCYVCSSGGNTKEAIARRAAHEATRGVRKKRA